MGEERARSTARGRRGHNGQQFTGPRALIWHSNRSVPGHQTQAWVLPSKTCRSLKRTYARPAGASVGLGSGGEIINSNNDHHKQDNRYDNRQYDHGSSAHRETFPSAMPGQTRPRPTTPYSRIPFISKVNLHVGRCPNVCGVDPAADVMIAWALCGVRACETSRRVRPWPLSGAVGLPLLQGGDQGDGAALQALPRRHPAGYARPRRRLPVLQGGHQRRGDPLPALPGGPRPGWGGAAASWAPAAWRGSPAAGGSTLRPRHPSHAASPTRPRRVRGQQGPV